ncbi:MAG: cation:dicarboxylase symporter family transporter [Cyanobacteria bacterium P01_G01_bin.4]
MNAPAPLNRPHWLLKWLRSPWLLLIALACGIALGLTAPAIAKALAFVGSLYLLMLKMCVLPILISGIITSVGRLMARTDAKQYVWRIVTAFTACFISIGILGGGISLLVGAGRNLDADNLQKLGILVNQQSIDLTIPLYGPIAAEESQTTLLNFFLDTIPTNIFDALSEGHTLQILVFVTIFGVALGVLRRDREEAESVFDLLESIYQAFTKLNGWLITFLPIGLFSLMASQFAQSGLMETIEVMTKFVIVVAIAFFSIYVLSLLTIWRQARQPLGQVFAATEEPTIVALATSSALATMPVAIVALTEKLGFDRRATDMVLPLAIAIGRFGQITYFILASLFTVELYDKAITPGVLVLVIVGSIMGGIASSGASGIVTLATLGIVLQPLDIPLEASLVLFYAIDPFIDPIRTLCTLHTGMAATAVVSGAPVLQPVSVEGSDSELALS